MTQRLMITAITLVTLIASFLYADDKLTEATRKYQTLLEQYEQQGGARSFAKRFLSFADDHPDNPAAVDALLWVVSMVPGREDTDTALRRLVERHLQSEKLGPASAEIADSRSAQAEPLLRLLLENSPHKLVQAHAGYYLSALLEREAAIVDQLQAQPDLAPRVLQYYGREYGEHLASLDPAKLEKEREAVYERQLGSFPDVTIRDQKLGDIAKKSLFRIRHLSVGKVAPDIRGEDVDGKLFKLSDYRGNVVMLTFWGHW